MIASQVRFPGAKCLRNISYDCNRLLKILNFPFYAIIAEGDKVVIYNSVEGVHNDDYGSFKAKGNPINAKKHFTLQDSEWATRRTLQVTDFMTLVNEIQA